MPSIEEEDRDFDEIVRLMRKHGWAKVCHMHGRQDVPPVVIPFSHPQVQVEILKNQMSVAQFWQGISDYAQKNRKR